METGNSSGSYYQELFKTEDFGVTVARHGAVTSFATMSLRAFSEYTHLIKEFGCTRLVIGTTEHAGISNLLEKFDLKKQITSLVFTAFTIDKLELSGRFMEGFENIQVLEMWHNTAYSDIDFERFPFLKELLISYDKNNLSWLKCPIEKLRLCHRSERDLTFLNGLKLQNLFLEACTMASLDGLETQECLKSIHIETARRLVDLSAIAKCKSLTHLKIHGHKKTTDWRFLLANPNWVCIGVEQIDTYEYLLSLKHLKSLWASKVLNKNEACLDSHPGLLAEKKRLQALTPDERRMEPPPWLW